MKAGARIDRLDAAAWLCLHVTFVNNITDIDDVGNHLGN